MKISFLVRAKLLEWASAQAGPEVASRLAAGVRLAELGKVSRADSGEIVVESSDPRRFSKGSTCTCPDIEHGRAPGGICKHRVAANAFALASKERGAK